jgi:hypothetical protein
MRRSLVKTLAHVSILWIGVMVGYYAVLPYFGYRIGYNSQPVLVAAYYGWWILVALYAFREIYLTKLPSARELRTDMLLSGIFAVLASAFLWWFSSIEAPRIPALEPATDLLLATPWYFLPKSVELLLQQLLIAAFVLELDRESFSLRTIVFTYATVFGGAHLLLIFGGSFPPTVLIMTLAAVISATFFPYLMLRIPRGFVYAYAIHWCFYASLVFLLRFAGPR